MSQRASELDGYFRTRWEDNIKMNLREIGFGDVDWIHWVQGRDRWRAVVNTVMNLRVP
jgi:ribosome biogenesis protein Nip4